MYQIFDFIKLIYFTYIFFFFFFFFLQCENLTDAEHMTQLIINHVNDLVELSHESPVQDLVRYVSLFLSVFTICLRGSEYADCIPCRKGTHSKKRRWGCSWYDTKLFLMVLFTNPSARAGYDTRSIFKRSLTGLNSEFSFS